MPDAGFAEYSCTICPPDHTILWRSNESRDDILKIKRSHVKSLKHGLLQEKTGFPRQALFAVPFEVKRSKGRSSPDNPHRSFAYVLKQEYVSLRGDRENLAENWLQANSFLHRPFPFLPD